MDALAAAPLGYVGTVTINEKEVKHQAEILRTALWGATHSQLPPGWPSSSASGGAPPQVTPPATQTCSTLVSVVQSCARPLMAMDALSAAVMAKKR